MGSSGGYPAGAFPPDFPTSQEGRNRVAPGGSPPRAPTDPDVQNSRIRLLETRIRYVTPYWWTILDFGSGYRLSKRE